MHTLRSFSNPTVDSFLTGCRLFQNSLFSAACLLFWLANYPNTAYAEGSMIEFPVSEDPYYVSRGPFVIQRAEKPLLIHVERFVPAIVPGDEGYKPPPFGDPPAPLNNPEDEDYVEIPFILVVEPAGETACHVKAANKTYQATTLVTEIEIKSGDTSVKVEFSVGIASVRGGDVEVLDELHVWLEGSEPEEMEEIDLTKGRALKVDLSQVKRLGRLVVTQADVKPRPLAAVDKLSVDEKISDFYSLLPKEFGANKASTSNVGCVSTHR